MNIQEAKNYIKDTVLLYLKKDEFGDYRIPMQRQRPIFLQGAPGIGKSAIMEQIASELGIAIVSYSMTHHTRQSALGLPFIKTKEYGGHEVDVSEYTMSEIIASVYETMEASGISEGILFLDEINCVSETLYPSMLQFLQFKTFGRHKVPKGWVIVTAGNPPQYNKSVREFDVVTLDRLKVMDVDEDYDAWRRYALNKGVHSAVITFLDNNRDYFYKIEKTAEGCTYVTARGWEDLSDILFLYEEESFSVSQSLVSQYINDKEIARDFIIYYDLYKKYKNDYRVDVILDADERNAQQIDSMIHKASKAQIDERLSLVGLILDNVRCEINEIMDIAHVLKEVNPAFKNIMALSSEDALSVVETQIDARLKILKKQESAGTLNQQSKRHHKRVLELFDLLRNKLTQSDEASAAGDDAGDDRTMCSLYYNLQMSDLKKQVEKAKLHLHNMFDFISKAYGKESNEMVIVVTELTINTSTAEFLASFGCDDYSEYKNNLKISDRKEEIRKWILEELN